jgi:hypothetical protein
MDRVGGGEKLSAEMACRLTGAQAGSNEVRMNRRTVAIARPTGWCMNGSDSIRTDRAPGAYRKGTMKSVPSPVSP